MMWQLMSHSVTSFLRPCEHSQHNTIQHHQTPCTLCTPVIALLKLRMNSLSLPPLKLLSRPTGSLAMRLHSLITLLIIKLRLAMPQSLRYHSGMVLLTIWRHTPQQEVWRQQVAQPSGIGYVITLHAMNDLTCSCQLKKSYNTVAGLKNMSGHTWDEEKGLGITVKSSSSWNKYVAVSFTATQ